jgi:predicted methyltransferase
MDAQGGRMKPGMVSVLFAIALAGCAAPGTHEPPLSLENYRGVLADPIRTERDRRMDETRHPLELLQFTGVRPGMRALDISTGTGYTAQLLALAVGSSGKVWGQTPRPGAALLDRLKAHPQANFIVAARPFEDPVPPDAPPLDLVTLVLNYHDISYLQVNRDVMNAKIFAALKPGGRYVIVDHSAVKGSGISAGQSLHRIDEAFVIEEVKRAGFVLDGEADFMRNPADPRTGTSNEPPLSDRFVLRFVKR